MFLIAVAALIACTDGEHEEECPAARVEAVATDQVSVAGVTAAEWLAGVEGPQPATLGELATGLDEPVTLTVTVMDPGTPVDVITEGFPATDGRATECGTGDHLRIDGVALEIEVAPDSGEAPAVAELVVDTWQIYGPAPTDGVTFGTASARVGSPPEWLLEAAESARPDVEPCAGEPVVVQAGVGYGVLDEPLTVHFGYTTGDCGGTLFEVKPVGG